MNKRITKLTPAFVYTIGKRIYTMYHHRVRILFGIIKKNQNRKYHLKFVLPIFYYNYKKGIILRNNYFENAQY